MPHVVIVRSGKPNLRFPSELDGIVTMPYKHRRIILHWQIRAKDLLLGCRPSNQKSKRQMRSSKTPTNVKETTTSDETNSDTWPEPVQFNPTRGVTSGREKIRVRQP